MRLVGIITVAMVVSSIAGAQGLPPKKVQSKEVAPTTEATEAKSSGGGFQFKTEDSGKSSRPSVNFKVPNAEEEKNRITADPVNEMFNDRPYKIAVGFPRVDFSFSYDPQNVAFTQKLATGFSPNFSGLSTAAFSFMTRLNMDLAQFWEAEYSQYDLKANAQAGGTTSILSSSTVPSSLMVRGFYCWIGTLSSRRFCVGGELGSDSTATLQYTTTTTLEMTKITDYMVGPSVVWQYPLSEKLTFHFKGGYLYGTAVGQNSVIAIKSDSKLFTEAGFIGSVTQNHGWSFLINYNLRTAKIEGPLGNVTQSWDVATSAMAGKLAYVYSF